MRGVIIWLTGLSGAGKSTLAQALSAALEAEGRRVQVLDGDLVRDNLCRDLGFSKRDRDINVQRIGFVADLLALHGVTVVVAAISPYREARDGLRATLQPFVEIHVDCPLDELRRRDVKGLYARAIAGEIPHFTGISDPYERPLTPDLRLDTATQAVADSLKAVLTCLRRRGHLEPDGRSAGSVARGCSPAGVRSLREVG